MADIKQTNFRINADSADAFRKFCEQQGFNQAQGFDHLLQVLELNQAKAAVPERITEIEEFELHVKKLMDAYVNSLEFNKTAEERALENFKRDLKLRDDKINELENELTTLKVQREDANISLKQITKEMEELKKEKQHAEENAASHKTLAENQQATIHTLSASLASYKDKAENYDHLASEKANLEKKFAELDTAYQINAEKVSALDTKINDLQNTIQNANTVIDSKNDTIKDLSAEVAKLQSATLEHEKIVEKEKEIARKEAAAETTRLMQEQINALIAEKAKLETKLEILQNQI